MAQFHIDPAELTAHYELDHSNEASAAKDTPVKPEIKPIDGMDDMEFMNFFMDPTPADLGLTNGNLTANADMIAEIVKKTIKSMHEELLQEIKHMNTHQKWLEIALKEKDVFLKRLDNLEGRIKAQEETFGRVASDLQKVEGLLYSFQNWITSTDVIVRQLAGNDDAGSDGSGAEDQGTGSGAGAK
jgi:hypothetical protein